MKTVCILLSLALALTAVALAPQAAASCETAPNNPVVYAQVCTEGTCRIDVLDGRVTADCV